jgi:ABC-type phosphate transport system substrate-binding protein
VIVVANQDGSVSEVTDTELRDLFTGSRTQFHDGSRAVPALLRGGPAHEVFLHHYIGGTSESFRAHWRNAVFTGQGAAPREFASEAALLQYIAATAGAMGYVSHLGTGEKVKILLVRSTNAKDSKAVGR